MPKFLYVATFKIFIAFIADDSKLSVIEKYYKYCFSVNINVAFLKFHCFDWIWIVLSLQHVKNRQEMMHYLVKPEINGKVKHAMVRFQHSTKKNKQQENLFFFWFFVSAVYSYSTKWWVIITYTNTSLLNRNILLQVWIYF